MFDARSNRRSQQSTIESLSCGSQTADAELTGLSCLPSWVEYLGCPVWVSSADKKISFINNEALELLGIEAKDCVGRPCSEVISSRDSKLRPFCSESCLMHRLAESRSQIKPVQLQITSSSGTTHWVQLVVIPVQDSITGGSCLVHCAISKDRAHAIEGYLEKVTNRTPNHHPPSEPLRRFKLTKREREILVLLTEDETLWGIAHRLNVSYTTVRNHVQHILAKLGVHSIIEAVAYCLVAEKD